MADLNLYDILEPCYRGPHYSLLQQPQRGRRAWPLGGGILQGEEVRNWAHLLGQELGEHPPCLDHRELTVWLDDAAVRQALHAAPVDITGPFQECTSRITYTHNLGSMIPLHQRHIAAGLRVLIYNGDHDMCVPVFCCLSLVIVQRLLLNVLGLGTGACRTRARRHGHTV